MVLPGSGAAMFGALKSTSELMEMINAYRGRAPRDTDPTQCSMSRGSLPLTRSGEIRGQGGQSKNQESRIQEYGIQNPRIQNRIQNITIVQPQQATRGKD